MKLWCLSGFPVLTGGGMSIDVQPHSTPLTAQTNKNVEIICEIVSED